MTPCSPRAGVRHGTPRMDARSDSKADGGSLMTTHAILQIDAEATVVQAQLVARLNWDMDRRKRSLRRFPAPDTDSVSADRPQESGSRAAFWPFDAEVQQRLRRFRDARK